MPEPPTRIFHPDDDDDPEVADSAPETDDDETDDDETDDELAGDSLPRDGRIVWGGPASGRRTLGQRIWIGALPVAAGLGFGIGSLGYGNSTTLVSQTTTQVAAPAPAPIAQPEPVLPPMAANFVQNQYTTFYTEVAQAPANEALQYAWSVAMSADPNCAAGFEPGRGFEPGLQANQATWFHADVAPQPPPEPLGPCDHNAIVAGFAGHPGTVTVVVTSTSWRCIAQFRGTESGVGIPPPPCTSLVPPAPVAVTRSPTSTKVDISTSKSQPPWSGLAIPGGLLVGLGLALSFRRRPTKPCDHEAAAVVDAENEFRAACTALDEAEKQRDAPPVPIERGGPILPRDREFLNNMLQRAVEDAAFRKGAARLNLEVAQKRLADCLAAAAAAAADAPSPTHQGEPSGILPTGGERYGLDSLGRNEEDRKAFEEEWKAAGEAARAQERKRTEAEYERFIRASEENRRERNILSPTREEFTPTPGGGKEGFDPVPPDASNPPPNDDDPPHIEIG